MSNDPVKLRDLIQSLASTMVVTGQFLDQSTVDLQNLYAHSGSDALAALTPPRFSLDEVTVDLSFVVEEAKVVDRDSLTVQRPSRSKHLSESQRSGLVNRLNSLAKFESELAVFQSESKRVAGERAEIEGGIKGLNESIGKLNARLDEMGVGPRSDLRQVREMLEKDRTLARVLRSAFGNRQLDDDTLFLRVVKLVLLMRVSRELTEKFRSEFGEDAKLIDELMRNAEARLFLVRSLSEDGEVRRQHPDLAKLLGPREADFNLQEIFPEVQRLQKMVADFEAKLEALKLPKEPKPPTGMKAPDRGFQPADYARAWLDFEATYDEIKREHREAVEAADAGLQLPRLERRADLSKTTRDAMDRANAAAGTLTAVDAILDDFDSTAEELAKLVQMVADIKGAGIRVRVDPDSISKAHEAARQSIRLTFRTESQETVSVDGTEVGITR